MVGKLYVSVLLPGAQEQFMFSNQGMTTKLAMLACALNKVKHVKTLEI